VAFLLAQSVALATLPDPTWTSGIFAAGDFDDLTSALVATLAVVDAAPAPGSRIAPRSTPLIPVPAAGPPVRLVAPAADPRGPPLPLLVVSHLHPLRPGIA
jgi:hypothetical protein